jgi:CDP-glucose 4,6-dehydratase
MLVANGAAGEYNVGPDDTDCMTTGDLADLFCHCWGDSAKWEVMPETPSPYESGLLRLDISKIKRHFGWKPTWDIEEAVTRTVAWYKGGLTLDAQIGEFLR